MTFISIIALLLLTGCTWSFSNVSTHGVANDVVDSEPTESNDIEPNTALDIPLTPLK